MEAEGVVELTQAVPFQYCPLGQVWVVEVGAVVVVEVTQALPLQY